MPSEIVMPRLGWTMEEGTFGEWLKADGAEIRPGDLLFTVESDKATQEVEAFDSGILRIPPDAPQPGDVVPVGARVAYVVQPGEPAPFGRQAATAPIGALRPASTVGGVGSFQAPDHAARTQPAISPRAAPCGQRAGCGLETAEGQRAQWSHRRA